MEVGLKLVDHCDLYVQSKARAPITPFHRSGLRPLAFCHALLLPRGAVQGRPLRCVRVSAGTMSALTPGHPCPCWMWASQLTADVGGQAPSPFHQQQGRLRAILEAGAPCCKARLLHYFASDGGACSSAAGSNWCGWHTDHSSLTGVP